MSMRSIVTGSALLAAVPFLALAQDADIEPGQQEYMIACAGCHGESGKGEGPIAEILTIETPDLTRITERTGGDEFPFEEILLVIDGRGDIRAHGSSMPVWGDRFVTSVRKYDPVGVFPGYATLVTKGRILALAEYLESIQETGEN